MVTQALKALEEKIDAIIETMELLALQVDELEQQQGDLKQQNSQLIEQKAEWERTLASLLTKLDSFQRALPTKIVLPMTAPVAEAENA